MSHWPLGGDRPLRRRRSQPLHRRANLPSWCGRRGERQGAQGCLQSPCRGRAAVGDPRALSFLSSALGRENVSEQEPSIALRDRRLSPNHPADPGRVPLGTSLHDALLSPPCCLGCIMTSGGPGRFGPHGPFPPQKIVKILFHNCCRMKVNSIQAGCVVINPFSYVRFFLLILRKIKTSICGPLKKDVMGPVAVDTSTPLTVLLF